MIGFVLLAPLARKGPVAEEPWASRLMPRIVVPEIMRQEAETLEGVFGRADALRGLGPRQEDILANSRLTQYLAMWRTVDAALRQLGRTDDLGAVATLAGVDMFGLALGAKPVEGLKVVHDVGRTIEPLTPDQARAYVAHADTLFEPTCKLVEAPGVSIAPWFAQVLAQEFIPRALTPCWTVHRRKVA